jgi:hypothetical protein
MKADRKRRMKRSSGGSKRCKPKEVFCFGPYPADAFFATGST